MKEKLSAPVARVLLAAMLGLFAVALPQSAQANPYDPWGTLCLQKDGTWRACGYGDFHVGNTSNGTRAESPGWLRDEATGNGNAVYYSFRSQSNAGICVAPQYTSCNQPWYTWENAESGRWSSSSWGSFYVSTGVPFGASHMRGLNKVCEDIAWQIDPCTGYEYSLGQQIGG